jgi:hypothetical protein
MTVHTIEFKNVSGKMRLTDPCYDLSVKRAATVDVLPGDWFAAVSKDEKGFVSCVKVLSSSYPIGGKGLIEDSFSVAVDSGQFGFFDLGYFPEGGENDPDFDWMNESGFYRKICNANDEEKVGVACMAVDGTVFGVVTSSGDGDGSYDVKGWKVDGEYVAFEVEFVCDDEDDWDEDDCYGEEE